MFLPCFETSHRGLASYIYQVFFCFDVHMASLLLFPVLLVWMITALERPIHTSAASDDVSSSAVSVMAFGAKGDGVTDDYLALRRAARYLCSNPGTTLVYPPGHY